MDLCGKHGIGCHIKKYPTLLKTVREIKDTKPYQIFLGNPTGSKVVLQDADVEATRKDVIDRGLSVFVHTPYILNLCNPWTDDGWERTLLRRNLEGAAKAGFRGVVIHVGKSVKRPVREAIETMRANLAWALTYATTACPLLLETPAGQGTETLRTCEDFLTFVDSFQDGRLRVCVDTCHVFASGCEPVSYLQKTAEKGLLTLVHYNDSQAACGSCVDRHAFVGTGHIGLATMTEIAEFCASKRIPMVIE